MPIVADIVYYYYYCPIIKMMKVANIQLDVSTYINHNDKLIKDKRPFTIKACHGIE